MAEQKFGEGPVAVFYADNPMVSVATMQALMPAGRGGDAGLVLLGMTPAEPENTDGWWWKTAMRPASWNMPMPRRRTLPPFCNAGGMIAPATICVSGSAMKTKNCQGRILPHRYSRHRPRRGHESRGLRGPLRGMHGHQLPRRTGRRPRPPCKSGCAKMRRSNPASPCRAGHRIFLR